MHRYVVRRRAVTLAALGIAVVLTACEDSRIKQLHAGMTRDSVVTVLAENLHGGGSDSFPNVFMRERYLSNGKNFEVLYYTPDNDKVGPRKRLGPADTAHTDSVPWKKLTPLVFLDNKLMSKGWGPWDSLSKAINIPVKNHTE